MKKIFYHFTLLSCAFFLGLSQAQAQCTDWLNPSPTTGWTNFGAAPCDDGSGCPFNEITAFEVFAAEAYTVTDFQAGGEYAFSICNGPGAGTWVPEFTIIAPSGAVDAFGPGDGDGCTITWTASEDGTYFIVINEAGECGGGSNTGVDNGYPALTCISGTSCAPFVCEAGDLLTTGTLALCPGDTFDVAAENVEVPTGGGFGWFFSNVLGGTGALDGDFVLTGAPMEETYDADLNGILSGNGFPQFSGTWVVKSAAYSDPTDAFNTICSLSADSLVVEFNDGPSVVPADNMDGTATASTTGGAMPYNYEWSDGQTTETATGLTNGETYTVTVTDDNGCTDEGSVTIGGGPMPCLDWLNPSPTSGWTDFGAAPCDDGSGCPFVEITDFEVFAAEAYSVTDFQAGGEYQFSMCNGPGAGTWVPEFTIIAPSGAVDAFGPGDGDGCTITWTASEDGTYLIVINEAGACGGGNNTDVDNGYPALTCISGTSCAPFICEAGEMTTTGEVSICSTDGTFDVTAENEGVPAGGGFGWLFSNVLGGVGALDGDFILTGAPTDETYDADLNGVLSGNGFPEFTGPWVVKSAAYSDPTDAFNTICSTSADSLIVYFGTESPVVTAVDNGDGSATASSTGGVAPVTYEWSDGQTTPTATGLADGDYTVTVTDANGCTGEATVTVTTSAVDNVEALTSLSIAPNPTTGSFWINMELNSIEEVKVMVFDVTGRSVAQAREITSGTRMEFDFANQPEGIYLVKIVVGDEFLSRRIMVAK